MWRYGYFGDKCLMFKKFRWVLNFGVLLIDIWFNLCWYLFEGVERLWCFGIWGEFGNLVVKCDWYYFRDLCLVVVV